MTLKQRKARRVVAENKSEQGVDVEIGCFRDGCTEQITAQPTLAKCFGNLDAEFRGSMVGGSAIKRRKTQPRSDACVDLGHP